MKIRTKLTLLFFTIVILILTVSSISIYFFSANYQKQDFQRRLKNRAINVAKVLLEVKEVDANLLKRLEQNNPASLPNQYVVIFDSKGNTVYQSDIVQPIIIDSVFLKKIQTQKEVWVKERDFEIVGFYFNQVYTVIGAASDVFGNDALSNLKGILVVTFFISVIFVSVLGWIYAGRVLKPINRIVYEVNTITELNLNLRLEEGNQTDELSKLAQAFNALLKRLQGVFHSQRFFIANASHEIKTPITVMTGAIEVALMQERPKEYYTTILRTTLGNLDRLNRLSAQLLLLAQTSSETPEKNFRQLRVDDIFWDVKSELQRIHPEYKIELLFDLGMEHKDFQLEGDEQLLKIVIQNLMDNGCKYSPDHQVSIHLHSHDFGYMTASFENAGTIERENLDKIFEPFFRGKSTRYQEGFGIGLSLVYWIVKLHGGEIVVNTFSGKVKFLLKLPISH